MVRQHRNVFISLKNREIGFRGRIRRNTLPYFAEEIAATSSTDNKACNLPGTPRCTFLISFSPDHKLVASSHVNHCINISHLSTGEHIQTLTGHPRSPWCVTFHPSSNEILASGCLGGEVRVWDLQGSSEVWQSDNHSMIASLSFHPRDQVLAIATNDQILLWDWRQPVPFASVMISSPLEKVRLVRFSPLGNNLLTGIANAPVDEEPEYDNLDVTRPRLHGVSEYNNPYPRPMRVDPSLSRHYSSGLPSSQGPSLPQQPERPMSPIQNETLEEAREYAAAVTLTALGLRRVNRENSFTWFRRGNRDRDLVPPSPQGIFYDDEDRQYSMHGAGGGDAEETSGRSGIGSQINVMEDQSVGDEGARAISDDSGEGSGEWSGVETSTENDQSPDESRTHALQENRGCAPMFVQMDVTNGDEIRVASTSVTLPQLQSDERRHPVLQHVARLQQLPTTNRVHQQESSAVDVARLACPDYDQGPSTSGSQLRPLDLASGSKSAATPSTSSEHVQDCETQNPNNSLTDKTTDCHSPEAKRHCPDVTEQDQAADANPLTRHIQASRSAWSTSSACGRSTTSSRQRLSFSDAEVSSALQDMGPSSSCHQISSSCEKPPHSPNSQSTKSAHHSSEATAVTQINRPSQSDDNPPGRVAGGPMSLSSQRGVVTTSTDSESVMQPALLSESLICPQAAVVRQNHGHMVDRPRAYTAHLGTIPLTAPPDSTSDSDSDASSPLRMSSSVNSTLHGISHSGISTSRSLSSTPYSMNTCSTSRSVNSISCSVNSSTSHSVNSTSQSVNSTSQSVNSPSPSVDGASRSSSSNPALPTSSSVTTSSSPNTSIAASQNILPQVGNESQSGMRPISSSQSRHPVSSGSNIDPLDLSVARTSNALTSDNSNDGFYVPHSEVNCQLPSCNLQRGNPRQVPQEVQEQSVSGSVGQTQRDLVQSSPPGDSSIPLGDYQPCNLGRRGTRPTHEPVGSSQPQVGPHLPVSQGMDLSMHNVRQGTRLNYAPNLPVSQDSATRLSSYTPVSSGTIDPTPSSLPPINTGPSMDPLSTLNPMNPIPQSDVAFRYRRYNLWRSHHVSNRQRLVGAPQGEVEPPLESQGTQPTGPSGVVYGARRVAPLHTRRHLQVALQNLPSRQVNDVERMDMPARVQRRVLRQSRQGPLRSQLGRLSNQISVHHHHPRNSIFDESYQPPHPVIHATINRAIASAFAGRGETAVANNIGSTTFRLQWWDFSEFELPDINDADHNVIVPHCKLHNDASCDISQDSHYLATFVPSPLGFPDDGVLAICSLMPHNFGEVLFTKSFGPNAITVSISPLSGFVMVGLASRKLHLHMSSKQLIGMIYKLHKEGAAEDSLLHVCDVDHTCSDSERRHHVSVNTVKWIPQPGRGLVYGTNRGDLRICSPSSFTSPDDFNADQNYQLDSLSQDDYPRHDLVHRRRSYMYMYQELGLRGLGLHPPSSSSSSSAAAPERRARGTQTPQRSLFSTATQTDEQGSP